MQNSGPWFEKMKQNPHPGHNLPSSNAKISIKKEHTSIKAVSFQISSIIVCLTIFFYCEKKVLASLYVTVKINTTIVQ